MPARLCLLQATGSRGRSGRRPGGLKLEQLAGLSLNGAGPSEPTRHRSLLLQQQPPPHLLSSPVSCLKFKAPSDFYLLWIFVFICDFWDGPPLGGPDTPPAQQWSLSSFQVSCCKFKSHDGLISQSWFWFHTLALWILGQTYWSIPASVLWHLKTAAFEIISRQICKLSDGMLYDTLVWLDLLKFTKICWLHMDFL